MTSGSTLRDAWRALRASPLVIAVAVLSLALGIGANTAVFSIVNSLLLRSLPVRDPQRLAVLQTGNDEFSTMTYPVWEQLRSHGDQFGGLAAYNNTRFNLSRSGETQFVQGMWVSGAFLDVMGVQPILGRGFTLADDRRGGGPDGPVAVISYGFWQRHFHGSPGAIGRTLMLERVSFTVVGVTPPEFFGNEVGRTFDVMIPLGTDPIVRGRESRLDKRSMWWLNILIRLAPGQSFDEATARLRAIQPQVRAATVPEHYRPQDVKRYLRESFRAKPASAGVSMLRSRSRSRSARCSSSSAWCCS